MYKRIVLLCTVLLLAAAVVMAADTTSSKPVDTYGEHKQFCYKRCKTYKTEKGKCSDYEWRGTTKKCCAWKVVGKGKCLKYKRYSKCIYKSKPRKLCLGHGYKQVCKPKKERYCVKYGWKHQCVGKGKNHHCARYSYHFICSKYDKKHICASYIKIPKTKYYYKTKCIHYKIKAKCDSYKQICKCQKKWKKVTKKHYKGWYDTYHRAFCIKKCHSICNRVVKRRYCVAHKKVRFARPKGYIKKCNKFVFRKFCVAQKKARFCTKWVKTKFCNARKKVRYCKIHKYRRFCKYYKSVPFCTQHHTTKSRCLKRKYWRKCTHRSYGVKVCKKYQFVGGKLHCAKRGLVNKCTEYETKCSPIQIDKYVPKKK
ncbi:hypothetical protein C9374_012983 [Naegleria lovaniensis]|uniref:Uncharacterized protein n=1 Tax=Naegleria lovaniensis TaxID=51637 RepID=A0AA88KBH5_NAELO|nr:uncharacterized protein C9374_013759 [Naegleria lovaniensis]XP_044542127.1 uncharacterized protein C9374_012983 [Naegleria lovaniensis]KAG2370884.1 hypothetical protein C9374_013759 [Naegleria lovaniensis]KAG2372953.1 hypothetical protein C9374_012983 [Naegleria lovaniensis]